MASVSYGMAAIKNHSHLNVMVNWENSLEFKIEYFKID
tara:strand:- start:1265 stop:1378 length:114 start_codon:yes stop_codon:yes gene_type:complete